MAAPQILVRRSNVEHTADFELSPDAAIVVMDDGSARVIDMGDRFCSIPRVGALMLRQTLQHGSAVAAEFIAREFHLELHQAEQDVRQFLEQLESRGVIRRTADAENSRRQSTLTARLLARAARAAMKCLPTQKSRIRSMLSLAKLSFRLCGWTATLAAWRRQFPQNGRPVTGEEAKSTADAIDRSVRNAAVGNLLGAECKERGLVCWAMARSAGLPAVLTIGVALYPLVGHCWCEVDSRVISDSAENCGRYISVLRYE